MRIRATSLVLLLAPAAPLCAAPPVEFNRDIRPILSDRCFYCHGPDEKKQKADLRLDIREAALAAEVIVPGKPDESELIYRITTHDEDDAMPPAKAKKPRLSPDEVALFRRWIEEGAEYQGHWAFQPLAATTVSKGRHPVDHFIDQRLAQEGIKASPKADRPILIRRAYLDLVGLLPTPQQVRTFVDDPRPDAYQQLVDELLASPHYGERWGRHWLDGARYADSDGYAPDGGRQMWPYRDWVINALNNDMPFDQFTIEQLAGDLLPSPTKSQLVATGFHRNTLINSEGGSDPEQFRVEAAIDRTNTTGAVWLGLTAGCAQCHTHKFDPLPHREYYEMFAFFNNGEDRNNRGASLDVTEGELFDNKPPTSNPPATPPAESQAPEQKLATGKVMIMRDLKEPRDTFILTRGDFTRPDKEAGELSPGVFSAVAPALPESPQPRTRLDLARWLVHPDNPLTARVTVNRIWMRYFGRGLVETEEDFGTQGSPPSHPLLLDALARSFIENGWSMKRLHRLIVTSETYQRSSTARPDLADTDPRNLLLAGQSRVRLDAEIVRDAALSASGLLSRQIGGPGVFPPQPEGIYAFTQNRKGWATSTGEQRNRRAMYTFFYRSAPYPLFGTFDAPDFQTTCTRRPRSNTPLQALTIANDPAFIEVAQGLAARVIEELPGDAAALRDSRIRHAFELALCRPPSPAELNVLTNYAATTAADFQSASDDAIALLDSRLKGSSSAHEAATLVAVARAILNTDNFITRE
jgi:hypothetical protein